MGNRGVAAGFSALFLAPFVIQMLCALAWPDDGISGTPELLFTVVVIAASLCVVTSGLVLWRGISTATPELAWFGLFFFSVSVLPLVHGLTTPGVLYGANAATMLSVVLAIPVGVMAASPTLLPRHGRMARAWRGWTYSWLAVILVLGTVLLIAPNIVGAPNMRSVPGIAVIGISVAGCLLLGWRHVVLARIARRAAPLVIAAGYSFVAGSFAVLLGSEPMSAGFWLAHIFDVAGVFAGTIGGFVLYGRPRSMAAVLAPIVAVEPIAALEVGLHPDVIDFVNDLDEKDPMTRDHVVRTAELAIEVAALMRLPAEVQRDAGLVGTLHDIGKLRIPDEVLSKPGVLNDVEWRIMQTHAEVGGTIVASSSALASLAPAVRGHHERLDGGGYPDGLAGDQIPLLARIVAVCDAYDAMAYTRRYRSGMELDTVLEILRDNAGTQWDPLVVQAVITLVSKRPITEPQLLASQRARRCDCLPTDLQGLESLELVGATGPFTDSV